MTDKTPALEALAEKIARLIVEVSGRDPDEILKVDWECHDSSLPEIKTWECNTNLAYHMIDFFQQNPLQPVSAPVECPAEYKGPFFVYDEMPQKIMIKGKGGSTNTLDVLDLRGWGYLTAMLDLSIDVATNVQDNFGKWVATTLNAATTSPPDQSARIRELEAALETIANAPAWGAPRRWDKTPDELRQFARKALNKESDPS